MRFPINLEEKIGKTVGRRREVSDPFAYAMALQKTANELRKATIGRGLCPKGVFKFKSHEEADQWMREDADQAGPEEGLTPRLPEYRDLSAICQSLNGLGARYVVVGGFAIIAAGMPRTTGDLDILIDIAPENEARVFKALEILADKAVLELDPGDVKKYTVVRVADEVMVDLMHAACGVDYGAASRDVVIREIDGVSIPFASPRLLWRMKAPTRREKDAPDLLFLREYFRRIGEEPPEI